MGRPTKEEVLERERLAELGLKRCSEKAGCGEILSLDEFSVDQNKWDKKRTFCLSCVQSKYHENKESHAAYYQEHREERKQYDRQRYLANPEPKRKSARKHVAKKCQESPMFFRLKGGRRRAKMAGTKFEDITTTDLLSHWQQEGIDIDICYYCNHSIDEDELELDHGQPISRGGGHTLDNLFPSHKSCNLSKGKRTVEEYNQYLMQAV